MKENNDGLYEVGAFLINSINEIENKKKKKETFFNHIGAMLMLLELDDSEKLALLDEIKNTLLTRISEKQKNKSNAF